MDDDIYPNDGGTQGQQPNELPEDRQKQEDLEASRVFQSAPILDDLIDHVKERIGFYNSIDSIPSTDKTTPTELLRQVNARKLAKELLEDELNLLETFKRQYT